MGKYPAIPERLRQIDALIALEHHHIKLDDDCYHLWERSTGARWDQNPANALLKNIQIQNSEIAITPGRAFWKNEGLNYASAALSRTIPEDWRNATFAPIPPSQVIGEADYDNRLFEILRRVSPPLPDIRKMVLLTQSGTSKQKGISPEERAASYMLVEELCLPEPEQIIIFDDVLTGGSHFAAMKMALAGRFPGASFKGLFLARSIHPAPISLSDLL